MTEQETLQRIAEIAHHGGLIGFKSEYEALCQIRKLTLPHWKPEECAKRSKQAKPLPKNWQECFEKLWAEKGKKGSKKTAIRKFCDMARGETEEDTEGFTNYLINHMQQARDELGFAELHLSTYLNQERWQS